MRLDVDAMREAWLNPVDEPEDERPVCAHCGEHFEPASDESDIYCSFSHWHLHCLGIVKDQIESWIRWEYPLFKVLTLFMANYYREMTDSSYYRFKRIIEKRYQQNAEI